MFVEESRDVMGFHRDSTRHASVWNSTYWEEDRQPGRKSRFIAGSAIARQRRREVYKNLVGTTGRFGRNDDNATTTKVRPEKLMF